MCSLSRGLKGAGRALSEATAKDIFKLCKHGFSDKSLVIRADSGFVRLNIFIFDKFCYINFFYCVTYTNCLLLIYDNYLFHCLKVFTSII